MAAQDEIHSFLQNIRTAVKPLIVACQTSSVVLAFFFFSILQLEQALHCSSSQLVKNNQHFPVLRKFYIIVFVQ